MREDVLGSIEQRVKDGTISLDSADAAEGQKEGVEAGSKRLQEKVK